MHKDSNWRRRRRHFERRRAGKVADGSNKNKTATIDPNEYKLLGD